MFHRLLVDWVGDEFQKELLRVVHQESNSKLPADSETAIKKCAEDKEEDSRRVTQDWSLSNEEIASQVQKFLGHALSRLLNEKYTTQNDEADDYGYSADDHSLGSMTARREEYLKSVLLREGKALMHYPKIVHLRFSKKESGMKVWTLVSKLYFEFGCTLIRSIRTRMNEHSLASDKIFL